MNQQSASSAMHGLPREPTGAKEKAMSRFFSALLERDDGMAEKLNDQMKEEDDYMDAEYSLMLSQSSVSLLNDLFGASTVSIGVGVSAVQLRGPRAGVPYEMMVRQLENELDLKEKEEETERQKKEKEVKDKMAMEKKEKVDKEGGKENKGKAESSTERASSSSDAK